MNITIVQSQMTHSKADGYIGRVQFTVEEHSQPYEITLQSKSKRDWSYALNFHQESGKEEEILQLEDAIEEDDELFDLLVDTALNSL